MPLWHKVIQSDETCHNRGDRGRDLGIADIGDMLLAIDQVFVDSL